MAPTSAQPQQYQMDEMDIDSPQDTPRTATPTPDDGEKAPRQSRGWRFYGAFACLCLVSFLTAIDATIISVAVPTIAEDINATAIEAFWMGTAFLLASTVFQPTFASFSHIFGRQPVLLVALTLFTIGSILCAVARNVALMLAGRVVQGIGAGGLLALTYVIATDLVSLRERGKWFSLISLTWAIGSVMGPVVGGALAEKWWPWIFWINLPFCAITYIAIPVVLTLRRKGGTFDKKLWSFDWLGAFIFISSLTSILIPLSWGGVSYEWSDYQTVVPLVVGLVGLFAFSMHIIHLAPRWSVDPLIRPSLFTTLTGLTAFFNTILLGIIVWAAMFYVPMFSEVPLGMSPTQAGIALFPFTATVAPAAAIVGAVITRTGRYRPSLWVGWVLTTLGFGLMMLLDKETKTVEWIFIYLVGGFGLGMLFSAASFAAQASASDDDLPFAAGMYAFCRSLGQCIGVAVGGVVFQNAFKSDVASNPNPAFAAKAAEWAREATALVEGVHRIDESDPVQAAAKVVIIDGFVVGLRRVWLVATILAGVGLVTALLFVKHKSLDRTLNTDQGLVDKRSKPADVEQARDGGEDVKIQDKDGVYDSSAMPTPNRRSNVSLVSDVSQNPQTTLRYSVSGATQPSRHASQRQSQYQQQQQQQQNDSQDPQAPVSVVPNRNRKVSESKSFNDVDSAIATSMYTTHQRSVSDSPPSLGPLSFEFDFGRSISRPATSHTATSTSQQKRWSLKRMVPVMPSDDDLQAKMDMGRRPSQGQIQSPSQRQSALRGAVPGPTTDFHRPLTRGNSLNKGMTRSRSRSGSIAPSGSIENINMKAMNADVGSIVWPQPQSQSQQESGRESGVWRPSEGTHTVVTNAQGEVKGRCVDAYGRQWVRPVRVPIRASMAGVQ